MRRIYVLILVVCVIGFGGCKKRVVIPDDTLADIFHDAFVVNAYIGQEHINIDSLAMYESIFDHYGYTAEDVAYTVGNFSRRKSARLGSVVEEAISRLERESKVYEKGVVILDTIRAVAVRSFTRTIYEDTIIKATRRADSTKLRVAVPVQRLGEYTVTYEYECEDDLKKYPRRADLYFEYENGSRMGSTSYTLHKEDRVRRTLTLRREEERRCSLVINLGNYTEMKKRKPKRQNLVIKNLKVVYKPDEKIAIDSLQERYLPIKIFANGFLIKKDSVALSADTTRVATPPADNR